MRVVKKDEVQENFRKKQKCAVEKNEKRRKEGVKASSRFSRSAIDNE